MTLKLQTYYDDGIIKVKLKVSVNTHQMPLWNIYSYILVNVVQIRLEPSWTKFLPLHCTKRSTWSSKEASWFETIRQ